MRRRWYVALYRRVRLSSKDGFVIGRDDVRRWKTWRRLIKCGGGTTGMVGLWRMGETWLDVVDGAVIGGTERTVADEGVMGVVNL